MSLLDITPREREIVHRCLRAVAESEDFFKDDPEFHTIFGVTRKESCEIANMWPNLDDADQEVFLAINNSMNNLLGYPHRKYKEWAKYFDFTQGELLVVFQKWKGKPIRSYFDGIE